MNKYFCCLPCRWACTLTPSTWAKSCWSTQKGWKCGLWSIWWLHMILSLNWRLNSLDKRPKLAFEYWKYKVINLVIQDFPLSPGICHIPRVWDCHGFSPPSLTSPLHDFPPRLTFPPCLPLLSSGFPPSRWTTAAAGELMDSSDLTSLTLWWRWSTNTTLCWICLKKKWK